MTLSGKLFQSSAAATGKARLPTVDSLIGGTTRRPESAERRERRPGWSATRTSGLAYRLAYHCFFSLRLFITTCYITYWAENGVCYIAGLGRGVWRDFWAHVCRQKSSAEHSVYVLSSRAELSRSEFPKSHYSCRQNQRLDVW